jgi:hypothetical protein
MTSSDQYDGNIRIIDDGTGKEIKGMTFRDIVAIPNWLGDWGEKVSEQVCN